MACVRDGEEAGFAEESCFFVFGTCAVASSRDKYEPVALLFEVEEFSEELGHVERVGVGEAEDLDAAFAGLRGVEVVDDGLDEFEDGGRRDGDDGVGAEFCGECDLFLYRAADFGLGGFAGFVGAAYAC